MYWYGVPDEKGRNLATCIWETRKQAEQARHGSAHEFAMSLTRGAYVPPELERYRLIKKKGMTTVEVIRIPDEPATAKAGDA